MQGSDIGDHFVSLMHTSACKSTSSLQMYDITDVMELMFLTKLLFPRVLKKKKKK